MGKNTNKNKTKKYPKIVDRQEIGKVQKTEKTSIRANIVTNEDNEQFLDIRQWYTTMYDDTPRPSTTGMFIPLELGLELAKQIAQSQTKNKGGRNQNDQTTED